MIEVSLTDDEALVLFDFVWRVVEEKDVSIQHRGEIAALNRLLAPLERTLVAPVDPAYADLLQAARDRLADRLDPSEE